MTCVSSRVTLRPGGGEGGIRTHGTLARTHDFQSCPFGHSGTSPGGRAGCRLRRLFEKARATVWSRAFSAPLVAVDLVPFDEARHALERLLKELEALRVANAHVAGAGLAEG